MAVVAEVAVIPPASTSAHPARPVTNFPVISSLVSVGVFGAVGWFGLQAFNVVFIQTLMSAPLQRGALMVELAPTALAVTLVPALPAMTATDVPTVRGGPSHWCDMWGAPLTLCVLWLQILMTVHPLCVTMVSALMR